MRHGKWILIAVALLAAVGCKKKAEQASDFTPEFVQTGLAQGSTGDTMTKLAKQYDIPIYPAAVPDTSHFSATANMGARVYMAYTTPDQPDRVVSFYKGQLGLASSTSGAVTILAGSLRNGSQVTINVGQKMDGSGTSFAIVITPAEQPRYDDPMASNPSTVATTSPQNGYQTPAPVPMDQPTDNTTYYIPTDRAEEDNIDDSNEEGGTSTDGQVDDQGGMQDQGEITDSGPPGG
jgi:hypothetical protein